MKKIVAIVLALAICCGTVFGAGFPDTVGHWAEANIIKAVESGFVNGYENGTFKPDGLVTRGEYLKMIVAMLLNTLDYPEIPEDYADDKNGWVSKYYNFAVESTLIKPDFDNKVGEVSPGVFNGDSDKNITRWEMAFLLGQSFQSLFEALDDTEFMFTDVKSFEGLPESVTSQIYNCANFGFILGDEKGNFNPRSNGTRAEAVVMVQRLQDILDYIMTGGGEDEYQKEINEKLKTYEEKDIPTKHEKVKFTMSNGKSFVIELYPEVAPQTCANFIYLVKTGFYDGLSFHRIAQLDNGFIAQGGDPKGDGSGGAGHYIKGEFASNGFTQNNMSHVRGVVSMARANYPDSASSQFFICIDDVKFLDGNYAAFGKVVEGLDVVASFVEVERIESSNGELSIPKTPIIIKKAEMM